MREIKFRAWQKYHKKMVEVTSISFGNDGGINGVSTFVENQAPQRVTYKDGLGDFFLRDERGMVLELMQYTGLKDVNGKDIYEGDIVHGYDQEPDRCDGYIGSSVIDVVNLKNGAFWIGDSWYKVMVMTPPIVEVIGNVHENPKLLEVTGNEQ